MATEFSINLDGLDKLIKTLEKRFGPRPVNKALTGALVEEAEDLVTEAKLEVPVDTGNLRDSGFVKPPTFTGVIECGFGGPAAPYALVVHENPRAGKTGGVSPSGSVRKKFAQVGKWKYLEHPFNRRRKRFEARVARELKRRLGI